MRWSVKTDKRPACGNRVALLVLLLVSVCICAPAKPNRDVLAERALDIARDDPRVEDILADFPEIELVPHYLEGDNVWLIGFLVDDRIEAGFASVSLERGAVVEFEFDIDRLKETDEDIEERERPVSVCDVLWRFRPHFEGPAVAWLSFVLVFLFVGNFGRILSLRNLDILLLFSLCPFLNIIWANRLMAYTGIFVCTLLLFIRCIADVRIRPGRTAESANLSSRAALLVLALMCMFHVQTTYEKGVDDSGIWAVTGAEYLQETGRLPYGTAFGWNCVYGPLMYMVHIPANWMFPPNVTFEPDGGDAEIGFYEGFETRGAKTTVLAFDFLAMLGLYLFGRRYGGHAMGLQLALLFALNPYILTLGGGFGLQQTSHITGIPFVVFALLFVARPVVAGLLLAVACGMLYYTVFLFPLWIGYYVRTTGWKNAVKFTAAVAVVGCVCLGLILTFTVPNAEHENMSALRAFLNDTVYQQQFKEGGYGTSEFSFWGQHPRFGQWGKPAAGVLYLLFCAALAFIPRRIDMSRLVAMTAAVLIGTQLVLSHGGGTYIGFYTAPLLIVLFGPREYPAVRAVGTHEVEVELS